MPEPQKTRTLGDELPEEIKRCQELLSDYESIGPAGAFGKMAIQATIDLAVEALASGDVAAMCAALVALRGCK